MSDVINVGVIGYGYWGPNLVRNFAETSFARVLYVSDLNPSRLAEVKKRYPDITPTTNYREMLADSRVDAVVIATPVETHFQLSLEALAAGKHVLVEKPLASSSEQVSRLIDEAARRRLVLMVDHTFVYTPAVRKIHELVRNGQLGQIYYYDSVRINLGLFHHDVNVMFDLAVHDLSILDFVLNPRPQAVSAIGMCHVPGNPENIAYITLFFADNLIAHIHVNWLAPLKLRRTLIGGSNKMIVYDDLEPSEKIRIYDKGITVQSTEDIYRMKVDYRSGDVWIPNLDRSEALSNEIQHFAQCIQKNEVPLTDGQAGLRVVKILEAASKSMQERGRPVEL